MKIYIVLIIFVLIVFNFSFFKRVMGFGNSDFHNQEGLIFLNNSQFKEALKQFKFALKKEKGTWREKVMHLRNISLAYRGLGDMPSVLNYKYEALNLCELNSYDFFTTKGDIATIKENIEEAIENFENAILLDSVKLEANNSLGLIYLGDYGPEYINKEKALKYNYNALKAYPFSTTKGVLGRTYLLMENYEKAKKYLSQSYKENRNDVYVHFFLGITNYKLGKKNEAKRTLSNLLKSYPSLKNEYDEIEKIMSDLEIRI